MASIDVLIYVTGLALIQVTGTCEPTLRVFFPAGDYVPTSLPGAKIPKHTLTTNLVSEPPAFLPKKPLTLNSPGRCVRVVPPYTADLAKIAYGSRPTIRQGCCDGTVANCRALTNAELRLELQGAWTVDAAKRCPPEKLLPQVLGTEDPESFFGLLTNFIDAKKPWEAKYRNEIDLLAHGRFGNTILLHGQVTESDLEDLLGATDLKASLLPKSACQQLTGKRLVEAQCVIAEIVNTPAQSAHLGAPDTHFAMYYDFFNEAPAPLAVYLSVPVVGEMCPTPHGAGSPFGSCIGGIVAASCVQQ